MSLDRQCSLDNSLCAQRALTSKACMSLDALPAASEADEELVRCDHVVQET